MINKTITENKDKPFYGAIGLVCFCVLFVALSLKPSQTGNSQPIVVPTSMPIIEQTFVDSAAILQRKIEQRDSSILLEAKKLTALTTKLNSKPKRQKQDVTKPAKQATPLARIGGELYPLTFEKYKGYIIFDASQIDSIRNEIIEESLVDHPYYEDTLSQSFVEHANEQIGIWKKVKSFFKKKK